MHAQKVPRWEISLVVIILLLAGILRLGWPGLSEFKADEARLLLLAYDMAEGSFARRGISSSVGFPNFPMSVWLYAIPSLLWQHPYAATLFTGLLNTAGVAGCYWFVRRYWGPAAAIAATLMLAVSPWAVIFSRKIWAQNLLPLFVLGWGSSAALAFVEGKQRWLWLHFLCLAIVVQIHLAAVALVPATLLFLLVFRKQVAWRQAGIGIVLAAATAVPFLTYLWPRRDTLLAAGLADGGGSSFTFSLDALRHTLTLSLGTNIHSLAGADAYTNYLAQVPPALSAGTAGVWGLLIVGGLLYLWHDASGVLRHDRSLTAGVSLIVLLWLLTPPLFFLWHNTPVFIHYFIATLPAQYVAAGIFLSKVPAAVRQWGMQPSGWTALAAWGLLAAALLTQLYAGSMLLTFVAQRATPGGFGTPLARQLAVVETAVTQQQTAAAPEILVAGPGENPGRDAFPAVYDTLLHGVPHRFVDAERAALFPAAGAVVIAPAAVGMGDLYRETAVVATGVPLRSGEGRVDVLTLPPAAAPAPTHPFTQTYLFQNWVNPIGYDWQMTGETAVFDLTWRTGGSPDPADYHFFNHLLSESGQRLAQADAAAFSPQQWQEGDVVVSRFVLEWEETAVPVMLRTGMYRFPALEPVLLLDVAGNPYSDAIEIKIQKE